MAFWSIVWGIRWIRHLNIVGRTEVDIGRASLYLRLSLLFE